MLNLLTRHQMKEWMAYATLHPFGERVADARIARLTASLYNLRLKKGGKPISGDKFMPPDLAEVLLRGLRPQSMEEMKAAMMSMVQATGGKHYRHGDKIERPKPKPRRRANG